MSFRLIARFVAIIMAVLFVILAFFPAIYAPTYGVAATMGVMFITQRAAPMFLAPMVILWVASDVERSPLRDAVAWGVAASMFGIAASGVIAFSAGTASGVILVAALAECAIGLALIMAHKN